MKRNYTAKPASKTSIEDIVAQVRKGVHDYMISECFDEAEVDAYSKVEYSVEENDYARIEVRAEISFDGMLDLCSRLDEIISKYDKDAYFDMDCPGISSAYITLGNGIKASEAINCSTRDRISELTDRIEDIRSLLESGELDEDSAIDYQIELGELEEQLNFAWQDDEAEWDYARECQEFNPDGSLAFY